MSCNRVKYLNFFFKYTMTEKNPITEKMVFQVWFPPYNNMFTILLYLTTADNYSIKLCYVSYLCDKEMSFMQNDITTPCLKYSTLN